jgi:hypothetical protein
MIHTFALPSKGATELSVQNFLNGYHCPVFLFYPDEEY